MVLFFDIGQDLRKSGRSVIGQSAIIIVSIVHGQAYLLEIIAARHLIRGLPYLLNCWQQQGRENDYNGDDNKELDESKPLTAFPVTRFEHG
jgi:hypothetical protein